MEAGSELPGTSSRSTTFDCAHRDTGVGPAADLKPESEHGRCFPSNIVRGIFCTYNIGGRRAEISAATTLEAPCPGRPVAGKLLARAAEAGFEGDSFDDANRGTRTGSKRGLVAMRASKGRQLARKPVIKERSDEPLYLQLARTLKDEIVSGVFPVGSQLPTEEELCRRFGVSRHTVREALRQLRDDDLVMSRKRAGTTVVPPRSSDTYIPDVSSINGLLAFAADGRVEIQSIKMLEIDEKLASRSGLTQGEECLAVCALVYRKTSVLPMCWAEYYIARDFAAVGRLLEHHTGPIFPLIEKYFGVRVFEVDQRVTACLMPAALATTLKVKSGTAAMSVRHSFKLTTGQIAEVAIGTHPASRFHHSMTMRRVKDKS